MSLISRLPMDCRAPRAVPLSTSSVASWASASTRWKKPEGSVEERTKAGKSAPSRKAWAVNCTSTSAWLPVGRSALSEAGKRR